MSQAEASDASAHAIRKRPHIAVALFAAAVASSLITSAVISLLSTLSATMSMNLGVFLVIWFVFGVATLIAVATFGIGWHIWAMRRGWTNYLAYAGAGLLLGALILTLFFSIIADARAPNAGIIVWIVIGALHGAATASLVWWIRRPGSDAKPQDVALVFD